MCQIKYAFITVILTLCAEPGAGGTKEQKKYILYDVNPGEGFNLRRDVFMRMAIMVRKLNIENPDISFILVLPPWGHLYHWQTRELGPQNKIPWSKFFDVQSINYFVPVIEFSDFLVKEGYSINTVYYLQGYKGGWTDGKYEEKYNITDCLDEIVYKKDVNGRFTGFFWGYSSVRAANFECMSVQGATRVLNKFLVESGEESIMLDRAESLLHDFFGDENYWGIRRAMKFSKRLVKIAEAFRIDELNSDDEDDNSVVPEDWREQRTEREERGGPYLCVHLRRRDYVRAREGQIPSIKGAAEQLRKKLEEQGLDTLYVSTDAPDHEFEQLRDDLMDFNVVKYTPSAEVLKKFKDGGVAILDQIICSHAKYFVGSYESTFSFRIQEEREIMGFPIKSTFDMLCPDGKDTCEKGSQWKIDWGKPGKDWRIEASTPHSEL